MNTVLNDTDVTDKAPAMTWTFEPAFENSDRSPLLRPKRFLKDACKDLLNAAPSGYLLFRRNIAHRYRHSSLGLFWAIAPACFIAAAVSFGQHAKVPIFSANHVASQFYAIFGVIMVQTFLESFTSQRSVLCLNRNLLKQHRSSLEAVIMASIAENLLSLSLKLVVLTLAFAIYGVTVSLATIFGVVSLISIAMIGTTLGLMLAPWNALTQDLEHIMLFMPWIIFASAPVFVDPAADPKALALYHLNPLTWVFDETRMLCYGAVSDGGQVLVLSIVFIAIALPIAWMMCRLVRPYIIERNLT